MTTTQACMPANRVKHRARNPGVHGCAAFVVFFLAAVLACAAQDNAAPAERFVTYSGKIFDTTGDLGLGSAPVDLAVKVYFFTKPEELQQYQQLLAGSDGQKKLAEALHNHYDMGQFRVGTGLAWAIRLTTWEETKKGRRLFLVANRFSMPPRNGRNRDPRDYPFTVIELNTSETGQGSGTYLPEAKVRFNQKHRLEVSDYLSQPASVRGVVQKSR